MVKDVLVTSLDSEREVRNENRCALSQPHEQQLKLHFLCLLTRFLMFAFNWQRIYIFELFIPAGLVGNGVRYYSLNSGTFVGHKSSKDLNYL